MNILIADDHHLILEGMSNILRKLKNAAVYEARNKKHLFYHLKNDKIDILFQDILFGEDDARVFLNKIKTEYPDLKIIIISSISDMDIIQSLLKQGVHGYLLKSDSIDEILDSIDSVLNNEVYISKEIKEQQLGNSKIDAQQSIILTPREKEILHLIMEEKTIKEIARNLMISTKTVEKHRANLFIKFQARNLAGLVKKAIMEGYF
ncbi:MAG TPA: response regulator transcription factor [Chitinophagaceae bacterium]|nr:response regulator transcription factor [Chitinophagaceae bacterium]